MQISSKWVAGFASLSVAATGLAGAALTPERTDATAAQTVAGTTQVATSDAARHAGGLRLNQLQQVGSHNSYPRELSAAEKQVQHAQDPGAVNTNWAAHLYVYLALISLGLTLLYQALRGPAQDDGG
jgi:hypothetical protein